MGQTSSHKHMRGEYMKSPHNYAQNPAGIMSNSSVDYSSYHQDDYNDEEEHTYPIINSRNSYVRR